MAIRRATLGTLLACAAISLSPAAHPQPSADLLRVLVWNIERGANPYTEGAEKALGILRELQPDICLLQESYDIDGERPTLGRWLASELGWTAWQGESPHLCVLTRHAVKDRYTHAGWHGMGARIAVKGEQRTHELDVYSIWIDYRAYLPYALRDDAAISDEDLLKCESEGSSRVAQAGAILEHLESTGRFATDVPLLVGGDWNCPSHLDWTEDTARVFRFKRALPLPVSRMVADAGFADTFRALHPDPLRTPGFTWTPMKRGTVEAPQPLDRIDRLYVRQPRAPEILVPVAAEVLPRAHEPAELTRVERAFPSDHGAVVIDFRWEPRAAEAPTAGRESDR